ncbi:hypothetical protein RvY_03806 [Ramazzottius varieornatus]|uniref:TRAF3-interacting protein 1 N-terminal domain-containing protein n=1 Tax=Ramazzottius varieornatus TaxID=947166 RepID=A0A1D1UZI9_RAMVA|nr:hypothetical protein RvY_03806 [Ramazzottius varieornatus]
MDESVVKKTQSLLGPLLANGPPLTDKLLSKPPLRFLHDVFVAIMKEHGIFEGLLDPDEISWNDAVANDKDSKAFFIAKVINYVGLASKQNLDVKAVQICAGQEAEKTNHLLQQLAEIVHRKTNNTEVVNQVLAKQGSENLLSYPKAAKFFATSPTVSTPKESAHPAEPPKKTAEKTAPAVVADVKAKPASIVKPVATANSQSKIPTAPKGPLKTTTRTKASQNTTTALSNKSKSPPKSEAKVSGTKKPIVMPSEAARPTTARRAPERPTTAISTQPMVRRNTFTRDDGEEGKKEGNVEPVVEDKPPPDLRFLDDKPTDDFLVHGLGDAGELDGNGVELGMMTDVGIRNKLGIDEKKDSGQLVSHLREAQKEFIDSNGYTKDDVDEHLTAIAEQQTARFKKDIDEICVILQKVSRLSDILTTQTEVLPEDLEEMDKDRQRYLGELQSVQQQLDEAYKVEEVQMEKLRRELAFEEDALFALTEDIASTIFRIREKRVLLNKLVSLKA